MQPSNDGSDSAARWNDSSAHDIAVASIRRHSMDAESWGWTVIGALHPQLAHRVFLHRHELPLMSAYRSEKSWYAFSTRRIIACHEGNIGEIDPRYGIHHTSGNFKGIGAGGMGSVPVEVMRITSLLTGETIALDFETGKPSMAPIYACMFWERTRRFRLPTPASASLTPAQEIELNRRLAGPDGQLYSWVEIKANKH